MSNSKINLALLLIIFNTFMVLHSAETESRISQLNKIVTTYKAIVENIDLREASYNQSQKDDLLSNDEITVNKQILIIPTVNIISSEENYQFEEYFSRTTREKLIGRILLEKTLGKDSTFHEFIMTLPKDFDDFNHFNAAHKEQVEKRMFVSFNNEDKKELYETLVRKIPSNTIPSHMLNFENYNWASSVVNCYAVQGEKKYYQDVRKLDLVNSDKGELLLVPGLNLFEKNKFDSQGNINLKSSIFAYKEHIYLNSDRYADETSPIYNELSFRTNPELFLSCGKFVEGLHHEEVEVKFKNTNWNLVKFDMCKSISCSKNIDRPSFVLKYEFDQRLLTMCQIDQFKSTKEADIRHAIKQMKQNKKISNENYTRSLVKCYKYFDEFLKSSNKTTLAQDLKHLHQVKDKNDSKLNLILKNSISQKKIVNFHQSKFLNKYLIEAQRELAEIKGKYI